ITFDPASLTRRLGELDAAMEAPAFWEDQRAAAKVAAERARTQKKLETFERLEADAGELDSMLEMADEDSEWRDELEASLDRLGRGPPARPPPDRGRTGRGRGGGGGGGRAGGGRARAADRPRPRRGGGGTAGQQPRLGGAAAPPAHRHRRQGEEHSSDLQSFR